MTKKNGILSIIDRYLGYILVVPALILIALFSLYPIIQSLSFSLFDYQVNDQQKNGMFFNRRLNVRYLNEKIEHIDLYYTNFVIPELDEVEDEELILRIEAFIDQMNEKHEALLDRIGRDDIVKVSNRDLEEIEEYFVFLQRETASLNEGIDVPFANMWVEAIDTIVETLNDTQISNNFVGFENFKRLFKDKRLWNATKNTLIFTVVSVFFELILGLFLAMIMNQAMRGRGIVRTMSLIPWAIPTSVAALMWRYLYDGDAGFIAHLLAQIKVIDNSAVIITRSIPSMIAVIFADIWKTTPYMALMLLAGLQTIPQELYESSSIDGANRFQQFTRITLPLLKPSILVALLFRTLDAFRVHDLIQVLTNGGPGNATESLSIYSYKIMRSQMNYGYGAAIVLFMAVMVGLIAFFYIKVLGVKVRED